MLTLLPGEPSMIMAQASRERIIIVTATGYDETGNPMTARLSSNQAGLLDALTTGVLLEAGRSRFFCLPAGKSLYAISTAAPIVAADEVINGWVTL